MLLQWSQIMAILMSLAILMGISTSFILKYAIRAGSILQKLFAYILLSMMNSMLLAPAIFYSGIFHISITDTFLLGSGIMAFESSFFLVVFLSDMGKETGSKIDWRIFTFLALFDEFLMSVDFISVLNSNSIIAIYHASSIGMFLDPIATIWFILPMSIEMALTALIVLKKADREALVFIGMQSLVMLFTPSALNSQSWETISVFSGGAVMTALLIFIFHQMYKNQFIFRKFGSYVNRILFTYAIMMASVMIFQYYGKTEGISVSIIMEMIIYFQFIFNHGSGEEKKRFWLADKKWTTLFLLNVFMAEFSMGGTFDFQYYGSHYFMSSLNLAPLYFSLEALPAAIYDSIALVGGITASFWFLAMMGIEMGAMVLLKMRTTKEKGNKIRLSLMLSAYAVYTLLLPNFVFTKNLYSYPFIGWSMGIGTAGGLGLALILPMLLTYVVSGSLSILFGARQLCSTFCTAPVMYQGAFYSDMKKYNRTSNTGKKISIHGEKETIIYRVVSLTVYFSLAITSILSIMDSYYGFHIYLYGTDPLAFTYVILFDIMWYAVFVTMPYFGSYGCINTGFCHWGNFNRWIARFGFFRLKVKSISACVTCESKACATACPVGNSSQPGSFIQNGEWKGNRCVGIGECLEACPYENIYFFDIRNYLRTRSGRLK